MIANIRATKQWPGDTVSPDPAPLSFAQQRIWFLDRLYPGSSLYTIAVAVRLRGPLNVLALQHGVAIVQQRQQALRMRVVSVHGEPRQVPAAETSAELPIIDFAGATEPQFEEALSQHAREPFDLATGPLLRCVLFRLGADDHALFVGMHHIASDWFSFGIFFKELSKAYQAFPNSADLPPLPLQFTDYTRNQHDRLTSVQLGSALDYWKQQLRDAPDSIHLPVDRPRPATASFHGGTRSRNLPGPLATAVREASRREGVTPFMFLLAAFNTLLFRLTRQDDILVGAPITGRDRRGTEQIIGFFSNTIVLRSRPNAALSFRDFLREVKAVSLSAFTHQDLPFDKLVQELRPDRALNHSPLFQVMFTLQSAWANEIALPGIEATAEVLDSGAAKFDLTLAVTSAPGDWTADMEFNSDLFDPATIDRWLSHFETLLAGVVANPEVSLGKIPLLTDAERRQFTIEWNHTAVQFPAANHSLVELFQEQARLRPAAVALVDSERQLTYAELNSRANQLAHRLRRLGIAPESVVGICCERNADALIVMLAVLKAGAAFLPMAPSDPAERLRFMADDAQIAALLTREKFVGDVPFHGQVICLDTINLSAEPVDNLSPVGDAESLAYVIYTSGSTGKAKGVAITHRSLLNHNLAISRVYDLSPSDRVLQFAALSFDVALEEIFPSWLSGCTIVLRRDEALPSIPQFLQFIEHERVTVLNLPTGFWHALVETFPVATIPASVRLVVIGGEAPSLRHYRAWQQHVGGAIKLINAYGLTETTITSTVAVADPLESRPRLPIGRPIANNTAYILDEYLEPVPIGVAGELYVGGEGVARGYLNRPQLTAERFNTFAARGRLFRTGDLARYLPDGNIEFLGRADCQLKLRGFRIEPGEIEFQLREHPAVRDALVIARHETAEAQLVAYVIAEPLPAAELRDHLKKRLPEYMVPASFVFLDQFPLTPSGKIDRHALPPPSSPADLAAREETSAGPRNDIEKLLCEIWCNLLNLPAVGVHDHYFRLGGHSLLAIRLLSRITDAFQVELPMSAIFEAPTVAELASLIEARIIAEIEQLSDAEAETLITATNH